MRASKQASMPPPLPPPPLSCRFSLPDEDLRGKLELTFFDSFAKGVACDLGSEGVGVVGGGWWRCVGGGTVYCIVPVVPKCTTPASVWNECNPSAPNLPRAPLPPSLLPQPGYHAMVAAFAKVYGFCKPYAITGSLPCIRELQVGPVAYRGLGFRVSSLGFRTRVARACRARRRPNAAQVVPELVAAGGGVRGERVRRGMACTAYGTCSTLPACPSADDHPPPPTHTHHPLPPVG